MLALSGLLAIAIACIHLAAGRIHALGGRARAVWTSIAGGVAVAYVFLHILPELALHGGVLAGDGLGDHGPLLVYLAALAGLCAFYALEHLALVSAQESPKNRPRLDVFRVHIVGFALYNLLIGYLLASREMESPLQLVLFAVAMGLHFLANDAGLRRHHRARYDSGGRFVLAGAALVGWGLGATILVDEAAFAVLFALLAGSIVLNVLKEELPSERESRILPFAAGAGAYAALLIAVA
ncbi:hypothetical protein [Salinarimonas sp.]|uniref:hypothetical protein n=1 Tax=Salinarimonas sp. TaxID=2766526 RepID=UPI00391A6F57